MPPRLAKLLAAVAALVMIGGALWFRGRDDGGDGGTNPQSGTLPKVVCVTELADICDSLDGIDLVRVEDAGTTADALAGTDGPPDFDAWITIDPWPAMVDYVRGQANAEPLFASPKPEPIASSDLVLLLAGPDRSADCGWDCVVDASGQQQRLAIPAADDDFGPQVVAEAFASHHGDVDFSLEEMESADGANFLARLLAFPPRNDAESTMATQGAAAYIGAGTLELRAQPAISSSRGATNGLELGAPEVPARADVVVAQVAGGESVDVEGADVAAAFDEKGWTSPAVDGPSGLPAADLLVALREKMER